MNLGMGLVGYGKAQPEIMAAQEQQQKKAAMASLFNALRSRQAAVPGAPGGGGTPGSTGGGAPAALPGSTGGFATGMPNMDQMLESLISSPGDPESKMAALENYGAFMAPFDKMQTNMEMKAMMMQNQQSLLDSRLQEMRDIAGMREKGLDTRTDKRIDSQGLTRDTGSVEKELAAQRSLLSGMLNANPRSIDTPEYKAEKKKYDDLTKELEGNRKGGATVKTAPVADAPGGDALPDPAQLSPTEERSLDGGKTWWYLKDGKPVKAGA